MDSRCRISRGMPALALGAAVLIAGCSEAVLLTHETGQGGVVTYLYKDERGGPMGSPYRREALKVMAEKCPAGYHVVKDGQGQSDRRGGGGGGGGGEEGARRWGIQFECKSGGDDRTTGRK